MRSRRPDGRDAAPLPRLGLSEIGYEIDLGEVVVVVVMVVVWGTLVVMIET